MFYEKLCECLDLELIKTEEVLKTHTTFRVGGPAKYYVTPKTKEQLRLILMLCKKEMMPYFILGKGSNLLVADQGFFGVVIDMSVGFCEYRVNGNQIVAQSGVILSKIANLALKHSLTGLEFAGGIPGSIGGAVVMNAGAYGGEIKDVLKTVLVMDSDGEIKQLDCQELELSYRHSCVVEKQYIILEAQFLLTPGNREDMKKRMEELSRQRREKQPLNYPNAGSTFKRPTGHFAGKLIEDAGLKGMCVGDAKVSEKHCGFVVNKGNASAKEILDLCHMIEEKVRLDSGIELELEIKLLGEF